MANVRSVRIPNRANAKPRRVTPQLKFGARRSGPQAETWWTPKVLAESGSFTEPRFSAVKEPNNATLEAIEELEHGGGIRFDSVEDLIRDLGI